jgi:hypothetical protein
LVFAGLLLTGVTLAQPAAQTAGNPVSSTVTLSETAVTPPATTLTTTSKPASDTRTGGSGDPGHSRDLVFILSGAFAIVAIGLLVRAVVSAWNEPYEFRRYWGGFGGSRTGWSVSKPLAEIGAAMFLALLAALLGMRLLADPARSGPGDQGSADKAGQSAAAASAKR